MVSVGKFLGRPVYDEKTQSFSFSDGTGVVAVEGEQCLIDTLEDRNPVTGCNGISVLGTLFAIKVNDKEFIKLKPYDTMEEKMISVFIVVRTYCNGFDEWTSVEDVFLDKPKANERIKELIKNNEGDDTLSWFIDERVAK